jgi:hypothetical protein
MPERNEEQEESESQWQDLYWGQVEYEEMYFEKLLRENPAKPVLPKQD